MQIFLVEQQQTLYGTESLGINLEQYSYIFKPPLPDIGHDSPAVLLDPPGVSALPSVSSERGVNGVWRSRLRPHITPSGLITALSCIYLIVYKQTCCKQLVDLTC